ncbi:hypothetical protein [Deinococcus multiflagellatus]|uniref:hypothetical protein n=1 Tax=Deinococcus multiflagellatus TaxID=1656887 RepID=UPI001CCC3B31|nr:hypothetical protein [Deinococcus multiflagellatus]MBZ9713058.1 hypothetical protein [Deinococcus multiflagellatus]
MTRKARDADQSTWGAWGTPYLNGDARPHTPQPAPQTPAAQTPAAQPPTVQPPAAHHAGPASARSTLAGPPEAAARPLSPEALRRAIQAEEQRQVFALLGRLRRSRAS